MPQSKHRKPKKSSSRSSVAQHKRTGKKLVPPVMHAIGDKLEFASWMNDRLPEMLWASLILASTQREEAFNEFSRVLNFVAEHERREDLENLTLTNIACLDHGLRSELMEFITANPRTSLALSTLLMFESLPARDAWEDHITDPQPSLELLMEAVGDTLFHQAPAATDCRWVWVTGMAASGRVHVNRELSDYVAAMTNYPNLEPGDPEGARVRASEGGLSKLAYKRSDWPANFWQEAWTKTPCFQLTDPMPGEQVQPSTTRQEISEVIERLNEHWEQTHTTTAVDAKHDAFFGMTFYAMRILTETMSIGISSGVLSRLGLRTLLELRINLKHLTDADDNELWRRWRHYGAGQAKLTSLKLEDSEEQPRYVDNETIERIASEDLWEELLTIDLGNWANADLRKMSEQAQLKSTYDQYYPWTSAYTHGAWGAIRETSFQKCGNPLHRLHRYPERQPLQDCLYDAVKLVDEILGHLDNEYPSFPHRLLQGT